MTEEFALQSLHYLLDQMSTRERTLFEARLQADKAACALFKSYADALAQHAAQETPGAPALSTQESSRVLEQVVLQTRAKKTSRRSLWQASRSLAWPVAAGLLLGLNIWQFAAHLSQKDNRQGTDSTDTQSASGFEANHKRSVQTKHTKQASQLGLIPEPATATEAQLARLLQQQEDLLKECEELQAVRNGLSGEAQRIAVALRTLSISAPAGNRLTAMELVDADGFAKGERKGLLDTVRRVLATPGSITPGANGTTMPPSDMAPGIGATTSTAITTTNPSTQISQAVPIALGAILSTAPTGTDAKPYAWTVIDGTSNEGSLNLYNLPQINSSEALLLWTKSGDSSAGFTFVGALPEAILGKSGNVVFRTPDGTMPSELLITREPKAQPPAKPAGPVILRGP